MNLRDRWIRLTISLSALAVAFGAERSFACSRENAPRPSAREFAAKATTERGLKRLSENEFEIRRGDFAAILSNESDHSIHSRVVPVFRDGVFRGFKLFVVQRDSIYAQMGIERGDLLRRVNGIAVYPPEKALDAYYAFRHADHISIELERRGTRVTKSLHIR
jgi:general secretion pathway protein C